MSKLHDLIEASIGGLCVTIVGVLPVLPPHAGGPASARTRWGLVPLIEHGRLARRTHALGGHSYAAEGGQQWGVRERSLRVHHVRPGEVGPNLVEVGHLGIAPPVLFEAMTYDVYLEWSPSEGDASLQADSPGLLTPIRTIAAASSRRIAHYRLEFGNEVGLVSLQLLDTPNKGVSGQRIPTEIGRLDLEVFPRKLDYQTDYRAMLSEIAQIAPALVLEATGRTSLPVGIAHSVRQTSSEWYEILRATARDLFAVLEQIDRDPQRRLHPEPRLVTTECARRIRPIDYARAMRIKGNVVPRPGTVNDGLWPRRVLERTPVPDFDVEGNRYLRWLLVGILARLGRLELELNSSRTSWSETLSGRAVAARWLAEIAVLRPELQRRLSADWLVDTGEHSGGSSTTLESHPLYSRAFALGRSLLRGLHVDASPVTDAATRPVSLLYEYWCFFAIVNILRRQGALVQNSAVQIDFQGSRIALRQGEQAAVTFEHRTTGRLLRVLYNRQYETPTVAQRPDASVHVESENGIHIFDAKYKLQFDPDYVRAYGGIGPRVEDVSTMHRYRDAIVERTAGSYTRLVKTACVLFPWVDSYAYKSHSFARSLESVGVGGLPFLPSCTDLVATQLDAIIADAIDGPAVGFAHRGNP